MGISVYLAIYEQIPQNVIRVRVYTQTDTQTHQVITIPLTSPILNASHTKREKRIPIVSHHCHLVYKSSNNGPRTHIPDRCTRAGLQMRGCSAAAGSGAWPLRQLILHGGPVQLRPVREGTLLYIIGTVWSFPQHIVETYSPDSRHHMRLCTVSTLYNLATLHFRRIVWPVLFLLATVCRLSLSVTLPASR